MHVETLFVRNLGGLITAGEELGPVASCRCDMRRDEKSDEALVPEKQANEAAELVGGRASAKRNAE